MRRSIAAGIWLALTVTATLIVWAAVSVVAADVTDRPAPVVAHHDVVVALQAGSSGDTTTTTTVTTITLPRVAQAPTTAPPRATAPATVPGPSVTTTVPFVGQATTTTVPHVTTTTKPPVPTTTTPTTAPFVGGTATYSTEGGVVAVGCTSFNTIRLVAALPNDGFQALVVSGGPLFVAVSFVRPGQNIPVSATCFFGQPIQFNKGGGSGG